MKDNSLIWFTAAFALWYLLRNKANATVNPLPTLPPYQYTPPIVEIPIPEITIVDVPVSDDPQTYYPPPGSVEHFLFPE